MQEILTHGSIIERQNRLPLRCRDRRGTIVFQTKWKKERLVTVQLRLPDGRQAVIETRAAKHPLFGLCDTVSLVGGPPLARFQAVDWDDPAGIPPLDRPAALPSGAGTAILNLLAQQALRGGRRSLRYRGPYPTGALFDALTECFRPQAELVAAFSRFTERVEKTAATGEMYEVPVDFLAAPFERVWCEEGVCVQLRDGVEKVYIGGRAYARETAGARRIRRTEEGYVAVVEIGGGPWAEVMSLDEAGNVIEGPKPLPAVKNPYVGRPLPDSVRAALIEALPPRAPELMQMSLQQVLADVPITWGDSGDEIATIQNGMIVLHAVLLERLAGQAPDQILTAIALAIEPVAHRLTQQRLERLV